MPKARDVKYIVIHCSAGFAGREAIEKYWKSIGWKSPGYHVLIGQDGKAEHLAPYDAITNGVQGFNSECIHICYIGGVEKLPGGKFKGKDTRTTEQHEAILDEIAYAMAWLKKNGKDVTKDLMILGHYHFSDDKNSNGVIESWERIKECPSFDALKEYQYLTLNNNNTALMQKLPKNRKKV